MIVIKTFFFLNMHSNASELNHLAVLVAGGTSFILTRLHDMPMYRTDSAVHTGWY